MSTASSYTTRRCTFRSSLSSRVKRAPHASSAGWWAPSMCPPPSSNACPSPMAAGGPPLPLEAVEKLRALGYLGSSAPVQPASSGPLPDPKDRLNVYKAIQRARFLNSVGRSEEANALLETTASEEPHFYLI